MTLILRARHCAADPQKRCTPMIVEVADVPDGVVKRW
jgi:hypothetical protein